MQKEWRRNGWIAARSLYRLGSLLGEVIAASGILGKVKNIKGEYVSIEVSDSVVFKLQKSAIANILPKGTIDSIK